MRRRPVSNTDADVMMEEGFFNSMATTLPLTDASRRAWLGRIDARVGVGGVRVRRSVRVRGSGVREGERAAPR